VAIRQFDQALSSIDREHLHLTVGSPIKFSSFEPTITGALLTGKQTDQVLAELRYEAEKMTAFHDADVMRTA
jgi:formyl-CoA transferase